MPCEHNKDPKTCVLCRDKALFRPGNIAVRTGQPGVGLPGGQNQGRVPLPLQNRGPVPPPALPPRSTKGQEHFDAFLKDVKGRTTWFTRSKSSIKGLLDFLENNTGNPKPFTGGTPDVQSKAAIEHCQAPHDQRIEKYKPAIKSLVAVWGSNRAYVVEPEGSPKAAALSASTLGGLVRDKATAEALLRKSEMRRIAVMDADNSAYDGSPGAVELCKRKQNDANFRDYLTTHMTLPNTVDKWVGLGTRTKKWGLGNCHQCMAAAFAELKAAPDWSSPIELVRFEGGGKSGHHFLVIGRPKLSAAFSQTTNWGSAFVADLWLQNLHRPGDGKTNVGTEGGKWVDVVKDCSTDAYLIDNLKNIKVDLLWTP